MQTNNRIVVIGGGISGLSAALRLAGDGFQVTLLEASDQLGGLGTFFERDGQWVDKFYHCVMPSDAHLRGFIDEVGQTQALYWKPTTMGFVHGGRHFDFNTPADLLRFSPLKLHERLRLGATGLLLRRLGNPDELDDRTTEDWLSGLFGKRIWEAFFRPLFYAKFGDRAATLPALYIWQRLGRESNTADRGYVRGGLKAVIDAAEAEIVRRGGSIVKSAPVTSVAPQGELGGPLVVRAGRRRFIADWVVSTLPMPTLAAATRGTALEPWVEVPDLDYQGVINALFFLDRPLTGHYWAPVVGSGTDFDGVVEMSALVDRAQYNGQHLAYVMKYGDRDSEMFAEGDESITARWTEQFVGLYAQQGLRREHVREVRIFRAPFVEPAYPLGYSRRKPGYSVGPTRLVMATTAQVYPHITSWNSAVRLCGQTLDHLYRRMGRQAPKTFEIALAA